MEERKDKNKKDSHNHGQEDKILFKYPDGYRKSLILFQKQAPFFFTELETTLKIYVQSGSQGQIHTFVFILLLFKVQQYRKNFIVY